MALTEAQEKQKQKQIKYWKDREEEQKKHNLQTEEEYARELERIYDNMLDECQKEIDAFYGKYAKKEGISIAEAKKRVSALDIATYERKAKRYVKDKDFSPEANEEMRIYNLTMKVNRLEMLKASIGLELISGHDELQKFMEGVLKGRTMDELKRQAGILGKSVRDNAKTAEAIVNASFHNAKFSERIWMHKELLRNKLDSLLQSGLIQGKNPRALARELEKAFGVTKSDAERLMRTELARVQTEAQKQSFEENGFTQYTFLALGDACDICADIDGEHFDVEDMLPGKNAPPMHPYCRCSIAAYEDDEEFDAWLDFLDKGGSTEEWNKTGRVAWMQNNKASEKGYTGEKRGVTFGTNEVDLNYIKSEKYRRKYTQLTSNTKVNDKIRDFLSGVLTKNSGTDTESLLIIDAETGEDVLRKIGRKNELGVMLTDAEIQTIREYKGVKIGVHNHPTNIYPTGSDFVAAGYRKYDFGIIATHDGKVYKYSVGNTPVRAETIDARIDKYTHDAYNETEKREGFKKALEELRREYGLQWEELG